MKTTTGVLPWVTLALLGITSAILCIAQPSFHGWLGIFYVGMVYGVLLGVYFVTCRGIRSAVRLVSLVVVSAIAWPIAYFGSFFASGKIPGGTVHVGDAIEPQFPLIAFGGVLGGVVLLIPVVLIFKPSSVRWGVALGKALLGIVLSAVVGAIAWEFGPTLGAFLWSLLPTMPRAQVQTVETFGTAAVFFVWQPVMALFIGWATSGECRSVAMTDREAQAELNPQASQTNGHLNRRTFAWVLASVVLLSLTRIIPVRLRQAHREQIAAKRASLPSSVDLRVAQPLTEEQALILHDIGDYQPGHVVTTVEPLSHEKTFQMPSTFYFRTLYTKKGEPVPEWPHAPEQSIMVAVQQYPSSEWAQHFAEFPARMYISPDDPKQHAVVTQFDNKVRSSQLTRAPGQTAIPLYYMWPSGDVVTTIDYRTKDENLEIVRAYLEKYPSSIR
jgi:hypothetical protein